jgi:phosphoglycerate dehydrogenase-like enzyme
LGIVEPFVLTLLFPPALTDPERALLAGALPGGVEVQQVTYMEPAELRSRRRNGVVAAEDVHLVPTIEPAVLPALARSHAVLALDVPPTITELCPELRLVQMITAGTDHVDVALLAGEGVVVANAAGVAAAPIAEFVMARLLQIWKHVRALDEAQAEHRWEYLFGDLVAGRTVAIVGLGAIGRAVARRARAFDLTVVATRGSARPGDTDPDVDALYPAAELDIMLGRADAVVVCLPGSPATEDLFDTDRFAAMRDGAIFVNVARGTVVDEDALLAALASGKLRAAALDVTREEPLPGASPLWDAPNCYISPHSSASLDGLTERCLVLLADNVTRLLAGDPLRNVVSP